MSTAEASGGAMTVNPVTSRKLAAFGSAALFCAVAATTWLSPLTDPLQLVAGLALLVIGCLPALQWARHVRPWFPCFEIGALTGVVFYAIPLLCRYDELRGYSDAVLETSALLVTGYFGAAVLVFNAVRTPRRAPPWALQKLLPDRMLRYVPAGLVLNTVYLYVDRFFPVIPANLSGSVRALCFGIGIIAAFVVSCEWGRDRLTRETKILFVVCLLVQSILLFSQLYLINGMSLMILSAIGYTTTRRRPPWLAIALCLPVVAVLHNGKSDMRKLYWSADSSLPLPTVSGLPAFFTQWFELGLHKTDHSGDAHLTARLAERASLFQMLCMSVDQVPAVRPHLDGQSYIDIPAQVIPRFLWPGKPSSLLSNIRLALYFHLISPDDLYSTSIAFGVVAEAYVNFGMIGVLALGALTGFFFKQVSLRSAGAPLFSALGIFMILLTAWSFQAELVLVSWLTSLFQACLISIGIPLAYRKFFGVS